jgi:hypothetical protein
MARTEDDIKRLSAEAAAIWNNPLTQDYMKNYIGKLLIRWMAAATPEERERLHAEAKGVEAFKAHFLSFIAAGKALDKKKESSIAGSIGSIV